MYLRLFASAVLCLFIVFSRVYSLFPIGFAPINSSDAALQLPAEFHRLHSRRSSLMNSTSKTEETGLPRAMR
jgi:hypothetical protein